MNKFFTFCGLLLCSSNAFSQSTFTATDDGSTAFLSRIEAMSGSFSDDLFLTQQAISRKDVAQFLSAQQKGNFNLGWGNVDNILMRDWIAKNGEWIAPSGNGAINSRKAIFNTFYKKQTDFFYSNKPRFFFSANPILGAQGIYEKNDANKSFRYNYALGAAFRMKLGNTLGAAFHIKYITEQPVSYINDFYQKRNTVAGVQKFEKKTDSTYSYWLPTGHLNVNVVKDYISIAAGYDYQKIGDGNNSLFLSDFSSPVLYGKIVTKIWKLQYENLYMRLSGDHHIPGNNLTNYSGGYKYATAHHLSVNVTPWLNLGLFEMVVFSRNNHFEMTYLNPIIFYRAAERSLGSPDKVAIGINAKAIPVKGLAVYGQFLLNEFTAKEFFGSKGYMHNKWGAQLGLKYYDAFTVPNLDVQAEMNMVRPYTFQHNARAVGYVGSNFTNNNLPLGHNLGAGFREFTTILSYRPLAALSITGKAMYYQQGIDTGNLNLGNDLSKAYDQNVPSTYGVKMIYGPKATGMVLSLNASYEIKPSLYFDLGGVYRKYSVEQNIRPAQTTLFFYSGLRLNLNRKDYTYR